MKKILLLTVLPLLLLAQATNLVADTKIIPGNEVEFADADADAEGWLKNFDEALTDAKEENRNVLLYFTGSDWCPPCKMLKKDLFETSEFKTIAAEYTLLYIDIPRNRNLLSAEQMEHNSNLLHKINKKGVFPLLVVLNDKGAQLDQYSGYSMDGKVQAHIDFLNENK